MISCQRIEQRARFTSVEIERHGVVVLAPPGCLREARLLGKRAILQDVGEQHVLVLILAARISLTRRGGALDMRDDGLDARAREGVERDGEHGVNAVVV